jgi:hypothetical protein
MTLTRCRHTPPCDWQIDVPAQAVDRREAVHMQVRHGAGPLDTVIQLDPVKWRTQAIEAIRQLVARGTDFALFEVHDFGVGDPPDPQHQWGLLSRDIHRLGIAHPVDFMRSTRPGTKQSSVRKWSGDASRCEDERHRKARSA